jgi:hypothetical protein
LEQPPAPKLRSQHGRILESNGVQAQLAGRINKLLNIVDIKGFMGRDAQGFQGSLIDSGRGLACPYAAGIDAGREVASEGKTLLQAFDVNGIRIRKKSKSAACTDSRRPEIPRS